MRRNIFLTFILLGIMTSVIFTSCSSTNGPSNKGSNDQSMDEGAEIIGWEVGNTAPDFTLNTIDQDTISLSQYSGKKVVFLYFLGNTWSFCIITGPVIEAEIKKRFTGPVQVLGLDIYPNGQANLGTYKEQTGVTFPLCYNAHEIGQKYNINVQDHAVIIDRVGKIHYRKFEPGRNIDEVVKVIEAMFQEILTKD